MQPGQSLGLLLGIESPTATSSHVSLVAEDAAGDGLGLGDGEGEGDGDGLGLGEGEGDGLAGGKGWKVKVGADAAVQADAVRLMTRRATARPGRLRITASLIERRSDDSPHPVLEPSSRAMYTYIVQRTQIYLSEDEAGTLDRLAKERGQTRSHLIREAIHEAYMTHRISDEEFEAALDEAFGAWADETPEQAAERDQWLRNLRGPGLGYKIAAMRGEPPPSPDEDQSR